MKTCLLVLAASLAAWAEDPGNEVAEKVKSVLAGKDVAAQKAAIVEAAKTKTPVVAWAIAGGLKSEDESLRIATANALGTMKDLEESGKALLSRVADNVDRPA